MTDADERRIKKALHSQPQRVKIACGRGLREVVKAEVARLLADAVEPHKFPPALDPEGEAQIVVGNLGFRTVLELALRCGTAKEVMLLVGEGRADTAKAAQKVVRDVPWDLLLPPGEAVAVRATSLRSRLFHERSLKESAGKHLQGLGFALATQDAARVLIDVRLVDNTMTVAMSVPGAKLMHRGYKAAMKAAAPMREDFAAAAAEAAWDLAREVHGEGWQPGRIVAPFAGSGTLGFEAVRAFLGVAPGLFRDDWPFLAAPCAPQKTVGHLLAALAGRADLNALSSPVLFIDDDAELAQGLRANCAAFNARLVARGLPAVAFDVATGDVFATDTSGWGGQAVFLAMNPPYGIRLDDRGSAQKTYRRLGPWLAGIGKKGPTSGYLFGREDDLALTQKALGAFEARTIPFVNGGLKLGILLFTGRSPSS